MFEIDDGFFVDPWCVMAVKSVGKGQCAIFLKGQTSMEGFLIGKDALEAATDVLEARRDDEEPEEEDENQEPEEE
jgi:hypothetical protein